MTRADAAARSRRRSTTRDAGTGLFASTFALVVFLVFLLFTVEVLFGLYARSTVTAVASDLAHRAARSAHAGGSLPADGVAHEARQRLGRYGDDADVRVTFDDTDADGVADSVAVTITVDLPDILPSGWTGLPTTSFVRTARARLDVFQAAP